MAQRLLELCGALDGRVSIEKGSAELLVYVRLHGELRPVEVPADATVGQLRQAAGALDVPGDAVLTFAGEPLPSDDTLLADSGLSNECTIDAILRTVDITAKTDTLKWDVAGQGTVAVTSGSSNEEFALTSCCMPEDLSRGWKSPLVEVVSKGGQFDEFMIGIAAKLPESHTDFEQRDEKMALHLEITNKSVQYRLLGDMVEVGHADEVPDGDPCREGATYQLVVNADGVVSLHMNGAEVVQTVDEDRPPSKHLSKLQATFASYLSSVARGERASLQFFVGLWADAAGAQLKLSG
eukprot:TRINITY_DN5840_c0_g1_i10.p1 TRINITY_DN5840_c0_g1~~TRINITY_DN5840_c0_g1_i10.p1  ORF type:complete len:317 (+),score=76.56 TRINITY_DN5840_c0_g1_i10:68-952(+)